MRRAVFLDRDGVINKAILKNNKPFPPENIDQFVILENVHELLNKLSNNGYLLFIVTNQPDVSRGTQSQEKVEEIHNFIKISLPIEEIYVCFHDDHENCYCRKPKPGLLFQVEKYEIDYSNSFMIGDRWRDIGAGLAAGCHTILINYNYFENNHGFIAEKVVSNLSEAVDWILNSGDKND
ncbi:MAG: HAD family hydrolase [Anaerolineaceae bacterium]|nr:HAD family hydrolase [Anaerolineaceae bacterium]